MVNRTSLLKIISFIFLYFTCLAVAQAEVRVTANINPEQATLDDDMELTLSVEGSGSVSDPQLPSM
ncbi:MAG: hypothetical protein ACD_73C00111G0001, partial [uncultured bacterium]